MKKILAATILASLAAVPASAGALVFEPPVEPAVIVPPPPPAAPAPLWAGPYIGGQVGWSWMNLETGTSHVDNDVAFGVHVGHDFQLGNVVLGPELSYNYLGLHASEQLAEWEPEHLVRLTGRAGFGFGNTLVYAKGGGVYMTMDASVGTTDRSGEDYGWVAGAGVEHLITNNISAGVEGLYHRFHTFDDLATDFHLTTLNAKVSFRF